MIPVSVPVTPLSGVLRARGIENVDVLKIDVAGYEPAVLRGCIDYLREGKIDAILSEINPSRFGRILRKSTHRAVSDCRVSGIYALPGRRLRKPALRAEARLSFRRLNLIL